MVDNMPLIFSEDTANSVRKSSMKGSHIGQKVELLARVVLPFERSEGWYSRERRGERVVLPRLACMGTTSSDI